MASPTLQCSQIKHRLSADDPVALDSEYEIHQFERCWECLSDEGMMTYFIMADGTYSSVADLGAAEPMTSAGRWAIRGSTLIWDAWESNIPLAESSTMDDQITFIGENELHLLGSDDKPLIFYRKISTPSSEQHRILKFVKSE